MISDDFKDVLRQLSSDYLGREHDSLVLEVETTGKGDLNDETLTKLGLISNELARRGILKKNFICYSRETMDAMLINVNMCIWLMKYRIKLDATHPFMQTLLAFRDSLEQNSRLVEEMGSGDPELEPDELALRESIKRDRLKFALLALTAK